MLVMVVFFIAFRWIHLSTPLIRLFLLVLFVIALVVIPVSSSFSTSHTLARFLHLRLMVSAMSDWLPVRIVLSGVRTLLGMIHFLFFPVLTPAIPDSRIA